MAATSPSEPEQPKNTIIQSLKSWGENPLAPALLATFITPLHLRPFQALPMLFPPVLLFSSYVNVVGYKADAAGVSGSWSGLYLLLALRRRQQWKKRFTVRGAVRGAAIATAAVNMVAGGVAYAFGDREGERRLVRETGGRFGGRD